MADPVSDQPEDFGIRLRWPSNELEDQRRSGGPPPDDEGPTRRPERPPNAERVESGDAAEGRNLPATLPVMAGRLETVHGSIATLSMRIDSLAGATNALRSQLTDRVTEYAETLARLARTQATDLDDYRHTTERITGELRRSLGDQEETLARVANRVEEIAGDVTGLQESMRSQQAESRSVLATGEHLTRTVTEGLDSFGARVLDQLEGAATSADEGLTVVRAEVAGLRRDMAELRRARIDVSLLAEIRSEVGLLSETVGQWTDPADPLAALSAEMKALRTEVTTDVTQGLDQLREDRSTVEELIPAIEAVGTQQTEAQAGLTEIVRSVVAELMGVVAAIEAVSADQASAHDALPDALRPVVSEVVGPALAELKAASPSSEPVSAEAFGAVVEEVISRRFNAFLDELSFSEGPEEPAEPAPPVADAVREALESALPTPAAGPSLDEVRAVVDDTLGRRLASFEDAAAAPAAALYQAVEGLRQDVTAGLAAVRDTPPPAPEAGAEPGLTRDDVAAVVDAAVDRLTTELTAARAAATPPEPVPAPVVDTEAIASDVRAAMATDLDPVREELIALRRRLGVRAKPAPLTEEQLAQLSDAVVARQGSVAAAPALTDDQIGTLADVVVARLQGTFELVADPDGG